MKHDTSIFAKKNTARFVEIKVNPNPRHGGARMTAPNIIEDMARLDWVGCPVWNVTGAGDLTLAGWLH
ncbi:hypothetical protein LLG95_02070 [bacterium]|nr:hypothetical protein [bacterium]